MEKTLTSTKTTTFRDQRLFNSRPDLDEQQLNSLSALFDTSTRAVLSSLPLTAELRALEIGAGNGSVAKMIAEQAGGQVLAIDLDTRHLRQSPGVEPAHHDIRLGVPSGPFGFIHARLVLSHLPARREIFSALVDELAPGGWLAIADVGLAARLLNAPEEFDHQVWRKYNDAYRRVAQAIEHDYEWAEQVEIEMFNAGLSDIAAEHTVPLARGDGPWTRYHTNLSMQLEDGLLTTSLSTKTLERYRIMLSDPEFRAHFFSLTYTVGRKPTA